MFKSIFERLFWTNIAILVVLFFSISITMTLFVTNYTNEKQYETVLKASDTIEYMTVLLQIENNGSYASSLYRNTLNSWSHFVNADITITSKTGDVFASTTTVTSVPSDYVKRISQGEIIKLRGNFGAFYSKKVLTIGVPIEYSGEIIGGMFFNTPTPNLNKVVVEILYMFLLSGSTAIIIAFVLVYIQSRRISRPIKDINKAAMHIASGNFEHRVEVTSDDEIGQLASSFNFMADSIARLEEMRSSFMSDVSHELRTPMTSITGFVQGILDKTIPPENEEKYLNIVLNESIRLTKLVNDMFDMSKMQNSEYKIDVSEFDICELIRLCIIQLEQRISDKNLELDIEFEDDVVMVLADKDAIRRVVINLLDNAVKFSYEGTKSTISVWSDDENVLVSIGNFGPGIESEDLRYVFDRFYKTDRSRNSDKKGAGLGLSLVKNIMNYHNQNIWVESSLTKENSNVKYTKFTFTLEKV